MSNYKFKTTNIRGKQYVEVNERIKFFRQEEKYNLWGIRTDFPLIDSEQCLCKCTITDADGDVIAQGHAHEVRGSSNINKTSYVENCETSAVGRALAMLGIGIDTSIASANEVTEAIAKQQNLVDNPQVQKLSKKLDAPVENIMDKAVAYIKGQTDKRKAFDSITKKYGEQLTEKQVAGLKKFVR
jgi:2',3'-cyclic-nucleotide 2'-phosphodiesterase (5'-nucleotidase family)